jgi:hypothetical protein
MSASRFAVASAGYPPARSPMLFPDVKMPPTALPQVRFQSLCKQCHDSTKRFVELHGFRPDIRLDGWLWTRAIQFTVAGGDAIIGDVSWLSLGDFPRDIPPT